MSLEDLSHKEIPDCRPKGVGVTSAFTAEAGDQIMVYRTHSELPPFVAAVKGKKITSTKSNSIVFGRKVVNVNLIVMVGEFKCSIGGGTAITKLSSDNNS